MVTAVDSSVIFDFILGDPVFGLLSRDALQTSVATGRVIACDVVWAEVAGYLRSGVPEEMLHELGIEFSPLSVEAAIEAGSAWRGYRRAGGQRSRMAAGFIIGAHALCQADRLLTRDRGFYRTYFRHLRVLDASHGR